MLVTRSGVFFPELFHALFPIASRQLHWSTFSLCLLFLISWIQLFFICVNEIIGIASHWNLDHPACSLETMLTTLSWLHSQNSALCKYIEYRLAVYWLSCLRHQSYWFTVFGYEVFDVCNKVWLISGKCSQSFILGICVGSAINCFGCCQYACFVHSVSFCSFNNSDLLLELLKDCTEIFLCQRNLWYNIQYGRTHSIRTLVQPVCWLRWYP